MEPDTELTPELRGLRYFAQAPIEGEIEAQVRSREAFHRRMGGPVGSASMPAADERDGSPWANESAPVDNGRRGRLALALALVFLIAIAGAAVVSRTTSSSTEFASDASTTSGSAYSSSTTGAQGESTSVAPPTTEETEASYLEPEVHPWPAGAGEEALIGGLLTIEPDGCTTIGGDCAVWPAGTVIEGDEAQVRLDDGRTYVAGAQVQLSGGFHTAAETSSPTKCEGEKVVFVF